MMKPPALIFDLDGTLVDSVYEHVSTWHRALRKFGVEAPQWKIHRAIGMSGKLFLPKLLKELGHRSSPALVSRLESARAPLFAKLIPSIAALPRASELLNLLRRHKIPFAIATSGDGAQARRLLRRIPKLPDCPIVTADDVAAAKPAPDLFELAASELGRDPGECFVVGDSVWDVLAGRRMKAAAIGLLSGGFDKRELQDAGAYRVYADPLELSESLEQLGISP
jgi:HAD superfamily hydrolase (TIGR01509 family)